MTSQVMIISKDPSLLSLLSERTSGEDFKLQATGDPLEALALAEQSDIDVAVVNFADMMNEGSQLLGRLKKGRPSMEVITISPASSVRFSLECMKLGAFADLLTPFDLNDLLKKISEALDRVRSKKVKGKWRQKLENLAASATFAQAGDFETARQIASTDKKGDGNEEI